MKRIRRTGFVLLLLLWPAVALAQATAVVARTANLHSTPSSAHAPIRSLAPTETVTLVTTTQVNGYYHVRTTQNEDGWVYHTFVKMGGSPPTPAPVATCGPGTEIVIHPLCPAVGMHSVNHQLVAYLANTDPGLRNMAKRHVPDPSCTPKPFTLDDARSLQNFIDNTFGDARTTKTLFQPTQSPAVLLARMTV